MDTAHWTLPCTVILHHGVIVCTSPIIDMHNHLHPDDLLPLPEPSFTNPFGPPYK